MFKTVSRLMHGPRSAFGGLEQNCYGNSHFSLSQRRKRRILFTQVRNSQFNN